MKLSRLFPCLACVSWLAAPALPQAGTPIIASIPGSTRTDITAINASGTMAGFYQMEVGGACYGFTATKPDLSDYVTIDIGAPGGQTFISGIGPEGTLVGSYCDVGDCPGTGPEPRIRAFLRNKSGAVSVWDYPGAGGRFTRFLGINARGQIVGEYLNPVSVPYVQSGFLLNKFGSDPIPIQYPDTAYFTVPNAINSHGIVVGEIRERTDPTKSWGFVWDGAAFTLFARPDGSGGSYGTIASSINDRGDIVGAYWLPDPWRLLGFHLRSGLYRDVAVEAKSVRLNDINNAGTIVGICYDYLPPVKIEGLIVPK